MLLLRVERDISNRVNRILKYSSISVVSLEANCDSFQNRIGLKLIEKELRAFCQVPNQVEDFLFKSFTITFIYHPFFKLFNNLYTHNLIIKLCMISCHVRQKHTHLNYNILVFCPNVITAHRNHLYTKKIHEFSCHLCSFCYNLLTVTKMLIKLALFKTVNKHKTVK